MTLDKRINAFVELATFLQQFVDEKENEKLEALNAKFYHDLLVIINKQKQHNGWFEKHFVKDAIGAIAKQLTKENLTNWLSSYEINEREQKRVGVIMAGNIPLVGFHDFICVLFSGNKVLVKLSNDDNLLLPKIAEVVVEIEPELKNDISFVQKLEGFDAVIATGSNNTARYFDYYFGKYPNIIRKNRNSIAVIDSADSKEDLLKLGKDIFQYFGLGCRNVSKLYVPEGYDFAQFFEAIFEDYQRIIDNNKYANNYDYNKAVYLLGSHKLLDNNFMLIKEDESLSSPVSVLHFEYYKNIEEVKDKLEDLKDEIQCVVSQNAAIDSFKFGEAQQPALSDYADGVDTMKFLIEL